METTTSRQKQILEFMATYQFREGFPPSIREICKALGLSSPGSLIKHLRSLELKGHIVSMPGKKRAWKLTNKLSQSTIPVIGRIAAGTPILASENCESDLPVDPHLFGSDEVFALIVKGDSMIEAQIRDGDLAIIKPGSNAVNGDIVAVLIESLESEATLKVFRKTDDYIELIPANTEYKAQIFRDKDQERIKILGKLVGIIRPKA
jgi:repressor LexA